MKKLIIAALLTLSTQAIAETVQMPVHCLTEQEMDKILKQFGEMSFVGGVSSRLLPDGKKQQHPIIMFANPETRSWTMVEKLGDKYCAIAIGENLVPIKKEGKNEPGV